MSKDIFSLFTEEQLIETLKSVSHLFIREEEVGISAQIIAPNKGLKSLTSKQLEIWEKYIIPQLIKKCDTCAETTLATNDFCSTCAIEFG